MQGNNYLAKGQQIDNDQRVGGRVIKGESRGRDKSRNTYRRPMGMDIGVKIDSESGWGGQGRGEQQGKIWNDCN